MKFKLLLIFTLLMLFISPVRSATFFHDEGDISNALNLFFGMKIMNDPNDPAEKEYWFYSSISPEFNLGVVSFGLDLRFQYNISDGKFYSEDWNDFSGIIRLIRFIKFGEKHSKYYIRFGELKGGYITPGVLLANYSNSPIVDREKRGLQIDLDFNIAGFESIVNDISNPTLLGSRVFARPLLKSNIPILSRSQVGFSYIGDLKAPSNIEYEQVADSEGNTVTKVLMDDNGNPVCEYKVLSAISLDINVPITQFGVFTTGIYTGLGSILNAGSGFVAGTYLKSSIFDLQINIEYRNVQANFMVNYFDEVYEAEKWNYAGSFLSKYDLLMAIDEDTRYSGVFLGLSANLFNKIILSGGYDYIDKMENGVFRINLDATRVIDKIKAYAIYTKSGISNPSDLFKIDDRSFIVANLIYSITKFFNLSLEYTRCYVYDGETGFYTPVESLKPNLLFSITF